jgi:hypothetical protein
MSRAWCGIGIGRWCTGTSAEVVGLHVGGVSSEYLYTADVMASESTHAPPSFTKSLTATSAASNVVAAPLLRPHVNWAGEEWGRN